MPQLAAGSPCSRARWAEPSPDSDRQPGSNSFLNRPIISSVSRRKLPLHHLHLFHPDAVLAGDRAAHRDADIPESHRSPRRTFLKRAWRPRIEHDQRMQIAVPGVENVADREPVRFASPPMKRSVGAILRARHHAILHIIRRTESPHRAERVLAAFP